MPDDDDDDSTEGEKTADIVHPFGKAALGWFGADNELTNRAGRKTTKDAVDVPVHWGKQGFDLFGGFSAKNIKRRTRDAENVVKQVEEIEDVIKKIRNLF